MYGATRRGAGVVELARLESVYGGNVIEGSNPSPSAKNIVRIRPVLLKCITYGEGRFHLS